jgi:ABC-type branched-subunit amino acid transport system substrate-binding protein
MPEFAQAIDGWVYVDLCSDQNQTLAAFYARVQSVARSRLAAAKGYDLARLVAEGIARAAEPTREGIRKALEHVKWLPAAQGCEGTLLGFGKFDRAALHGSYLVLRQWRNQRSEEIIW